MLKQLINFVKEYLSIIAIVPLILGGLLQLYSLTSISPSYIRFFSVSQQIADGLLMAFILGVVCLIFIMSKIMLFDDLNEKQWEGVNNKGLLLRGLIFIIITAYFCSKVYYEVYLILKDKRQIELIDVIKASVFTFYLIGFAYNSFYFFNIFLKNKEITFNIRNHTLAWYIYKFLFANIKLYLFLFLLLSPFLVLKLFNNHFSIPNNLSNIDYLLKTYKTKNLNTDEDSVKILYMNDKYIFISDSTKIQVLKFESLFVDNK